MATMETIDERTGASQFADFKKLLMALAILLVGPWMWASAIAQELTEHLDLAYYEGEDFSDEKHRLDLIISDHPLPSGSHVKAYNHSLGESDISFFAHKSIAKQFQKFPDDLDDAPILLPVANSPLRRSIEDWFDRQEVTPRVVAEFDDSALLKAFGEAALGVFPAPTTIAEEVCSMYHSRVIGRVSDIGERYFAISPERRLKHPAVLAITESARRRLL